jgi:glutathione S-transferase
MPMLILRSSPASPFGRKVKIAALELGLMDRIEIVVADTNDPAEPLRRQNPLGKIPTLVLEDGTTLFDSRVIVDYLDHIAGGGRLIPTGDERFAQLRLQALADGLCDAALLQVYEIRFRPEEGRNAAWVANQAGKVERALAALEAAPPTYPDRPRIGEIALAAALGYLDLRFAGTWRANHPHLVAWLDTFAARVPAFEATRFKG